MVDSAPAKSLELVITFTHKYCEIPLGSVKVAAACLKFFKSVVRCNPHMSGGLL